MRTENKKTFYKVLKCVWIMNCVGYPKIRKGGQKFAFLQKCKCKWKFLAKKRESTIRFTIKSCFTCAHTCRPFQCSFWLQQKRPFILHVHSMYGMLCLLKWSSSQSTHRVTMATFWRTFHHNGKICPGWRGRRLHAHPLSLYLPHCYKAYSKWSSPLENFSSRKEKAPCWWRNILPLAHTGILHSSMLEISSVLWSRTFSVLLQENSVRATN